MKTIKVKLTNPEHYIHPPQRLLKPRGADAVRGTAVFDVPDVSFWRRRVRDGTLQLVDDGRPKRAKAAKAPERPSATSDEKTASAKSDKGKAAKE